MTFLFSVLLPAAIVSKFIVFANPATGPQSPLSLLDENGCNNFLPNAISGDYTVDDLSNSIISSLSGSRLEEFMVKIWEQQDVVDVMTMMGYGEDLDAERFVQVFGEDAPRNMTEGDKLRLKKMGLSFMDITDHQDLGQLNAQRGLRPFQAEALSIGLPEQSTSIKNMIIELDDSYLRADIAKLSSFWNRNYQSRWGLLSSNWIHDQVGAILSTSDKESTHTSVRKFKHKFVQNSIIARIEGTEKLDKDKEIIILSAHQDSLNYKLPFFRAPGADDDGSGSVTILQVLRSIVQHNFIPPPGVAVEFHWFAAEEGGLLGSQDVAAAYEKAGKKVRGILHMDMTAFVKNGTEPIIAFFKPDVDTNLTAFAAKLVEAYLPLGWNTTSCGKSCGSDHMSFHKAGYPVVAATEALFENFPLKNIHTPYDDTDQQGQYSFEHMLEFVKLGLAFIAELAVQTRP